MSHLVLENVTKRFSPPDGSEGAAVLSALNLEVREGELLVILGPSGAGKTTLLRLLAGLENPTQGRIQLFGKDASKLRSEDRDLAMVFQSPALYPHLTVRENLALGLHLRSFSSDEVQRRLDATGARLGLTEWMDRYPDSLSGGQAQRVALGRALIREPKLFLFDEPFAHLDLPSRLQLRAEVLQWHRELRSTTVYVTHDQSEAMALGNRIAVLHEGRIVQVAEPEVLYRCPTHICVAQFLGSPPINLCPGMLESDGSGSIFRAAPSHAGLFPMPFRLPSMSVPSRRVVLGVRPEQLFLANLENGTADLACITGTVDWTEFTGPDRLVQVSHHDRRWVARIDSRAPVSVGSALSLQFDPKQAHLFADPEGVALPLSSPHS